MPDQYVVKSNSPRQLTVPGHRGIPGNSSLVLDESTAKQYKDAWDEHENEEGDPYIEIEPYEPEGEGSSEESEAAEEGSDSAEQDSAGDEGEAQGDEESDSVVGIDPSNYTNDAYDDLIAWVRNDEEDHNPEQLERILEREREGKNRSRLTEALEQRLEEAGDGE